MRHITSQITKAVAALIVLTDAAASASSAEKIVFKNSLTVGDRLCLTDLLRTGYQRVSPEDHREMIEAAKVGRADLKGDGRKWYLFYIEIRGYCGSAGCKLLMGEPRKDGTCREIYNGAGFRHAVTVLPKRDHGYRRLYTPCEIRFDGRQYDLVREECPTLDVQR